MSTQVLDRIATGDIAEDGLRGVLATRRRIRLSRRLIAVLLGLIAAGGVAWYGWDWWRVGRFIQTTDDAYVGGNVTTLSPHVAGFVAKILVGDNQFVHAGQLLVELDRARLSRPISRMPRQSFSTRRRHLPICMRNTRCSNR